MITRPICKEQSKKSDKNVTRGYIEAKNNTMMNKLQVLIFSLIPLIGFSQYELNNKGGALYLQKGSLLTVQGDFINDTSAASNGLVFNDGTIEVQGNFQNSPNASFRVFNDNTSTERVVKFTGSGTQSIIGQMNTPGTASFYNLVVDKTSASDVVQMQADVAVEGSLAFGASSTNSAYNPSNFYTNNNQKGLLQTYTGSNEYLLSLTNGSADAISGYPVFAMNGAPTTGYVLTSGDRGSSNGGLQREVASSTSYDYPVGTAEHGFNAVRMNFTSIPSGGGLVKGKFNDGTDNNNGYVGTISQQCIGCTQTYSAPDNDGYNHYFASNPCNNGSAQWITLQDAIMNHGYWSFASADNNANYNYSVEVFPNSFTMQGNLTDDWRTLKYPGAYGFNPSGAGVSWNQYIDSVSSPDDLLAYSRNTGSCYTGDGVPGGVYSGFGHYSMEKGGSDNALPVKMLYINATASAQIINVNWATAIEVNNSGFNVERSTDGINFSKIGWVQGHDNSTVQQTYTYADKNAASNTMYYYRLQQVDNNGGSALSNITNAEIGGNTVFTVSEPMPNPATVSSKIMITSNVSQDITVKVYNMLGQVLSNSTYTLAAGNNSIDLNVQNLASGNYSTVFEADGQTFSKILSVSK